MWKGTGRSGIGDQTIIGEYDDWDGLSMNGKQWKNPSTRETRNLSGADYWHQRKALEPKTLGDIPTYINGKANVNAFADKPLPKPTKKTIDIRDRICPQQKTYSRLEQMQKDLEQEFTYGKLTDEEYLSLSAVLDKKLHRAWVLLSKAMNWKEDEDEIEEYESNPCDFTVDDLHCQDKPTNIKRNRNLVGVLGTLNDDNVFKVCWCHWLDIKCFCGDFRKELKVFVENTKKFVDYVKAGI